MTLDEGIAYCHTIAKEEIDKAREWHNWFSYLEENDRYEKYSCRSPYNAHAVEHESNAVAHEQLAEWLKELKERRKDADD